MIRGYAPQFGTDLELPLVNLVTRQDVARLWPWPQFSDDKYSRGVLAVVVGTAKYPGAGVLVATAALHAGQSYLRYLGEPAVQNLVLAAAPEVVLGAGQAQALVMGSGFDGQIPEHRAQLGQTWREHQAGGYVLLDAGALALVGSEIAPHERCLLTPHAGEAARLAQQLGHHTTREDIESRPYYWARWLARETGATVLLKGEITVIAAPDGELFVVTHGTADLATAGSGDVLAGVVGFLLASTRCHLDLATIAAIGAWLHAEAGRLAAPTPSATKIAAAIHPALKRLQLRKRYALR